MSGRRPRVLVVGAGVVGVCTALRLKSDGCEVSLVDPNGPGEGASSGNAGGIAVSEIIPLATPGMLRKLPGWLADPTGPLAIRWRYLPMIAPWLFRFWRAGRMRQVEQASAANAALVRRTHADWEALLAIAGCADLMVRKNCLTVYDTAADFGRDLWKWELRKRLGIPFEVIDGPAVRALEPALVPAFARGVINEGYWHVKNPLRLVRTLARAFAGNETRLHREAAVAIETAGAAVGLKLASGHRLDADVIVLATGAWSHRIAATIGDRIPLETERGYHLMLPQAGVSLERQIMDPVNTFVATPMEHGLRLAGTVEFAGLDAPANWARSDILLQKLRRLVPSVRADGATRWMGHRPSLPDSLPVIGRSPRDPRVVYAFGHGHVGLTFAATTAQIVSAVVRGQDPGIDLSPFRPDRFG